MSGVINAALSMTIFTLLILGLTFTLKYIFSLSEIMTITVMIIATIFCLRSLLLQNINEALEIAINFYEKFNKK